MENRCFVCGRVFSTKQGLRGHLKAHKGAYLEASFLISKREWETFKELCRVHGLTTCHMIGSIVFALTEAFRRNGTVEFDARTEQMRVKPGSNPIIVHLSQTFLGKPRSAWKVPVPRESYVWPPSCVYADDFHRFAKEVGCLLRRDWVKLKECWSCFQRGSR